MQIHLVLPGLLWLGAPAISPVAGLALPALSRLLGRGEQQIADFVPLDRQLAALFGLNEGELPLAALRRHGEADAPADATTGEPPAHWLCADPVHLHFARDRMLLSDFPAEGDPPDADETAALLASLNDTFADLGRFEAPTPARWYLRLAAPTEATLYPLNDVIGRPIAPFLPEGRDGLIWHRTMNELQIVLHNHPVNQAREAAGRRTVNSLWLWGAGALPGALKAPQPRVQASDPLLRGLARAAGLNPAEPDPDTALAAPATDTLVVLDSLRRPALQLDLDAWRAALAEVEARWFAPLAAALDQGRLAALTLNAPGDHHTLTLRLGRQARWKFWRRPQPLDALLKTLAPPPAALPTEPPPENP